MTSLLALGVVFRHLEAQALDILDVKPCSKLSVSQLVAYRDIVVANGGKRPAMMSDEDWAPVATFLRYRGFEVNQESATLTLSQNRECWHKLRSIRGLVGLSHVVGGSTREMNRKFLKVHGDLEFAMLNTFIIDTFVIAMSQLSQHSKVVVRGISFWDWDRNAAELAKVESLLRDCGMEIVYPMNHGRCKYIMAVVDGRVQTGFCVKRLETSKK